MGKFVDRVAERLTAAKAERSVANVARNFDSYLAEYRATLAREAARLATEEIEPEEIVNRLLTVSKIAKSQYGTVVGVKDQLIAALDEAYDIHRQENRTDVLEKWRGLIFHTATAIGYAIVVLLTIYFAHEVLQIPVPLTRIPL